MDIFQEASIRVSPYADGPKMLMGSGNYFDFLSHETSLITKEDVAYGLAFTARFRGQTVSQATGKRVMYSVAEHCVRGSHVIRRDLARAFLLHELGEVPWGDVISPQKIFIPAFGRHEDRSLRALARLFGLKLPMPEEVKRIDLIMLATERRDLMPPTAEAWKLLEGVEPLPDQIVPMDPNEAAERFLERFHELAPASA